MIIEQILERAMGSEIIRHVFTLMHHEATFVHTLVIKFSEIFLLRECVKKRLCRCRWAKGLARVRIPFLSLVVIKSALVTPFALLRFSSPFINHLFFHSFLLLSRSSLLLIVDIARVSLVFERVI